MSIRIIFILIILVILTILMFRKLYIKFILYQLKYTPSLFKCDYRDYEQRIGKKYMSNNKIIICGLIRDGQDNIPHIKKNINNLVKMFDDYLILIVENDSSDNTRKILLDWASKDDKVKILGCGVNSESCNLKLEKTIDHEVSFSRINKMIYIRNLYLDYINQHKEQLKNYEYTAVWDLDIHGYLYSDGIFDTFYNFYINENISMIGANGVSDDIVRFRYYDPYALLNDKGKQTIEYDSKKFSPLQYSCDINDRTNNSLRKVISCFAGIAFYKTSKLFDKKYRFEYDNVKKQPYCEHITLNRQLDNVYLNTKMIYYVISN
jgi:hypothetical protein